MKNNSFLPTVLLASLLPISATSIADPSGVELGVGVNQFLFGDDTPLDDSTGYRLSIGYRFDSPWGVEFSYNKTSADLEYVPPEVVQEIIPEIEATKGFNELDALDVDGVSELDVEHYYLDVLYHFNNSGKVQPYLALGYGFADAEIVDGDTFDVGAGIKFYVNENLSIRPDIHFGDVDEFNDSHMIASLSLSWIFGSKSTPAPKSAPKAPLDSDKDGVVDANDQCPATPAGVSVDASGCALDSDKDGVADHKDECADTPAGADVDAMGCPELAAPVSIELKVNFDSNSDVVKQAYMKEIQNVADFLKQYPDTNAVIEGHTDTSGSALYNKNLSQRRADAVAKVIIERFGIDASRVSAVGYGEERPIADESTLEGKIANRRVIAEISTGGE